MKKSLITTGLLGLAMVAAPAAMAKTEKVLACHITGISLDGVAYEGHVIHIAKPALGAHCSHGGIPDHYPEGRINDALVACDTDDETSRCVIKNATGKFCNRPVGSQLPVSRLCDS